MGLTLQESFAEATPPVACSFGCERKVRYYDRLSDGRVACLSCSYREGFKPGQDCRFHSRTFDPADPDMRVEMLRISRVDIERADPVICRTEITIPEDLFGPIKTLRAAHGSSLNEEIVAALGWYTTMCLRRAAEAKVGVDAPGGVLSAGIPDQLK
jgi:hypothetical protein